MPLVIIGKQYILPYSKEFYSQVYDPWYKFKFLFVERNHQKYLTCKIVMINSSKVGWKIRGGGGQGIKGRVLYNLVV